MDRDVGSGQRSEMPAGPAPDGERSAGYLLVRPVPRPAYVSPELLPARLLSASACICPRCPDTWAVGWARHTDAERRGAAHELGIAPERLGDLVSWVTRGLDDGTLGWPGVFFTPEGAGELVARFLPPDTDVTLIGLALPPSAAETLLAAHAPGAGQGTPGLYKAVSRGTAPAPGGTSLGYEPLGYEYGAVDSWLCNGLEREVDRVLGIRPNPAGLIATLAEAERATAHISREDVGAEPVWWAPWRLTRYPIAPRDSGGMGA